MPLNPDRPNLAYVRTQIERVLKSIEQITSRGSVAQGRVVPERNDIAIHTGRRLDATVMFLDISDFSARPSVTQEQQQNILETLALFFTEMIRVIEDYGGVVEKNTGDGLMAYFVRGAGSEHSAQQQSVSAALTMFDIAGRVINPILERSGLQPVSFRITMDHGPITIARVGAAQRFNGIVAIGSTANIASKMLAFASPDTILIGEGVLGGLPDARRQIFVRLQTRDTGWVRVADGNPYGFFQYTGRWLEPTT